MLTVFEIQYNNSMKNFLYKLVFPFANKLYFGRASSKNRYGTNNKPNSQFFGPHHNKEVQKLLDEGEYCYWRVVKELKNDEDLVELEDTYLNKVWKTDEWNSRPSWLLNRSRRGDRGAAFGDLNPIHLLSLKQQQENVKSMQTPEVRERRDETYRETVSSLETHWNEGRTRPDLTSMNKTKLQCPHCELKMNPGSLARHIKAKHTKKHV